MEFPLPEIRTNSDGDQRHVGFEIEFAGMDPESGASLIKDLVGGTIHHASPFSIEIRDTRFGTFVFEVDAAFLKEGKYKDYAQKLGIDIDGLDNQKSLETMLRDIALTVVPCEIVMPPIAMDELGIAEELVDLLRGKKAKGTRQSVLYAFGLHINIEAVCMDASCLLNHIRAFSLLYDWICEKSDVDLSRRITPYINRYPDEYTQLIMRNDYRPDINRLIKDYLEIVKSRNHALDMLPLFASIDEKSVMQQAAEPDLVKPRPAFHYRLANCRIDEEEWHIANEWQYWLEIEKLATNEKLLNSLMQEYRDITQRILPATNTGWIEKVSAILS